MVSMIILEKRYSISLFFLKVFTVLQEAKDLYLGAIFICPSYVFIKSVPIISSLYLSELTVSNLIFLPSLFTQMSTLLLQL